MSLKRFLYLNFTPRKFSFLYIITISLGGRVFHLLIRILSCQISVQTHVQEQIDLVDVSNCTLKLQLHILLRASSSN
jgi:hypothetical protein